MKMSLKSDSPQPNASREDDNHVTAQTPATVSSVPCAKWKYWFFVGLIGVSVVYVAGLLALQLTTPADGYSASTNNFSPQGFTIRHILIEHPNGLQKGDLIVSVGGKTIEEWLALAFRHPPGTEERWQVGQVIPYAIVRNGERMIIPIKLGQLSLGMVLSHWGIAAIITLTTAAIGVFVFLKRPQDQAARAMLVMTLGFAVQMNSVDVLDLQLSDVVNRRVFLAYLLADIPGWMIFVGAVTYFSLVFPTPKRFAIHHPLLLRLLYPAPALFVVALSLLLGNSWTERIVTATWLNNLLGLIFLIIAIVNVIHSYRTAQTATTRSQMRWILWGGSMPIAIYLIFYALPGLVSGQPLLPSSVIIIPFLLTPMAFAFAIIKYRLMDIDTVINRSLVYLTLTALLGGLYLLLVAILTRLLQLVSVTDENGGILFSSAILIAVLFNPLRDRVQSLIDRAFYRDKLNFRHLLEILSQELALTINLSELIPLLTEKVPHRLNIAYADLMLPDRANKQLQSHKSGLVIPLGSKLIQHLLATKHALIIPPSDTRPALLTEPLRTHGVELCLPLIVGNKLVGLYIFGPKRSLQFYNQEEISFLTTLGHEAAISTENARLYEQVAEQERWKRDLEIAHQIQMDLLPQSDPQVEGFEIVGYSQPAQEVGGDFYAYYYLPNGRLSIAVGDVSGKGLPGALYMAITASILETHAPFYDRVGALLDVVNHTLYPRMQARRMNTGLAYLMLEPKHMVVQVSNAGLISPLLIRCNEAIRYLDPNSLPLGTTPDGRRRESLLILQPGDVLLLVSDGIIEAMNGINEIYGFERFEALASSFKAGTRAGEILDRLLADVQQFMDGTEQHDDMTVVIVRVTGLT